MLIKLKSSNGLSTKENFIFGSWVVALLSKRATIDEKIVKI